MPQTCWCPEKVSDLLELELHAINCEARKPSQEPIACVLERQQGLFTVQPSVSLAHTKLIAPLFSSLTFRAAMELSVFILHRGRLAREKRKVSVTGSL